MDDYSSLCTNLRGLKYVNHNGEQGGQSHGGYKAVFQSAQTADADDSDRCHSSSTVELPPLPTASTPDLDSQLDSDATVALEDSNGGPSLQNCLSMNQAYQEMLAEAVEELQVMLRSNRDVQRSIVSTLQDKKTVAKPVGAGSRWYTRSLVVFVHPYFKDVNGMRAPPNADEIAKRERKEQDPYMRTPKQWSKKELQNLTESVRTNMIDLVSQPYISRKTGIKQMLATGRISSADADAKTQEIEREISSIKELPVEELKSRCNRPIDWLRISAIDFQGERDPISCELMWKNGICKGVGKWSKQEDSKLKALAEAKGCRDWDSIALELGGERTAFQCAQRYHGSLTSRIKTGAFSPEEDNKLLMVIALCKTGDEIPWTQVSYYMEGRTRTQLYYRWERALNPVLRRGRWTTEEDTMLIAAVQAHGQRWSRIKDFLPGRTSNQCRERYVNSFSGNYTFGRWTADEDAKLIELLRKYGPGKWAQISREMPWRNDNMILMRYKRLQKKHNLHDLTLVPSRLERGQAPPLQSSPQFVRHTSQDRRAAIVNRLQTNEDDREGGITKQKCSLLYNSLVRFRADVAIAERDDDDDPDGLDESEG